MKNAITLLAIIFTTFSLFAQTESRTSAIRGTVVDEQSEFPLPGVSILLLDTDPIQGVSTDMDGRYRLDEVTIGRHTVKVSFIGYEPQVLSNLLVVSGKDLEINVKLRESILELEVAEVVATEEKHESINKMATVSSRSFSVEEASRYSGSLQDPSRMAQNFAGVSNASDDRNDIIIRGNSPTGVLWRMEGIDIPSPNHFGTLGTTGGPVSMLNINNLSNSDFMTSAFSADYGNALAGVFDLRIRPGNKDKYEFLGQMGFNGFEFGAEGPLGIGKNASFLVNYRYSTLGVFSALGLEFGTGSAVPEYQDITFKIDIPTEKAGRFSLFGVGGISFIEFKAEDSSDQNLYSADAEDSQFGSNTGWIGLTHNYFINERTKSTFTLAATGTELNGFVDSLSTETGDPSRIFGTKNRQVKYLAKYTVNSKLNKKNTINVGAQYELTDFLLNDSVRWTSDSFLNTSDYNGNTGLMQAHVTWQNRLNEKIITTSGVHAQYFSLNDTYAVEPRLGLKYQLDDTQSINFGAGMHSQLQPIPVYFTEDRLFGTTTELKNDNLDFNKSLHFVLGYDKLLSEHFRIKAEVYYQDLYNIAVDRDSSSFSMLNTGVDFGLPDNGDLVNNGTGSNAGIELTAERFFHDGYYLLTTVSLFDSKYAGSDGVERSTAFDGGYVFNFLGGKEFKLGENKTLGFDTKFTYAGGRWYTPVDVEQSLLQGEEVRPEEFAYSEQYDAYLRLDFKMTFRVNGKKAAQQWSVDLRNVTNQQNIFIEQWNNRTNELETTYQIGFFPDVQYKIFF